MQLMVAKIVLSDHVPELDAGASPFATTRDDDSAATSMSSFTSSAARDEEDTDAEDVDGAMVGIKQTPVTLASWPSSVPRNMEDAVN
jgi:hypothetical protein